MIISFWTVQYFLWSSTRMGFLLTCFYAFIGIPLVSLIIKYTYKAPSEQGMANISIAPWSPTDTIKIGNNFSVVNDTNCMMTLHIVTPTVRIWTTLEKIIKNICKNLFLAQKQDILYMAMLRPCSKTSTAQHHTKRWKW